jgi:uncharacterized membrane protein
MKAHHIWQIHPAVRSDSELTLGEKASDKMKALLATWGALFAVLVFIGVWMVMNSYLSGKGHKFDPYPWILLNLMLSCFAALQCFILLIANKRGEQIAAELALHTEKNTEDIAALLQQNHLLTEQIKQDTCLLEEIHKHISALSPQAGDFAP